MLKTTTILSLTATLLLMTTAWSQAPEPLPTQAPPGVEQPSDARYVRGELRERVRERLERADGQGRRGAEAARSGRRGIQRNSGQSHEGRGLRQSRGERAQRGESRQRGKFDQRNEVGQRGSRPERGFARRSGVDQRASLRRELAELKELRRELKLRITELKARAGKPGQGQSEGRGQRSPRSFRR